MTSSTTFDIAAAPPSAELVRALVDVGPVEPADAVQLAMIAAWERVISWATACQAELLVAIEQDADVRQYGWHAADAARSLADQLGLALGISGGAAQRRVNTAAALVEKVPAVHEALKTGGITTHHARLAASGAAVLDESTARAVGAAVMADGSWRTPSQFAEVFARLVHEVDPRGAETRNRRSRLDRRVSARSEPDGMGSLWAFLAAEDSRAVYQRVDDHARTSLATNTPGDERTLEQRRADALVELVCGSGVAAGHDGSDTDRPAPRGRGPRVDVTVSLSSLIGGDNAPAYLAGYGWIDAATARRICADPTAVWYRLLTDPASGALLDRGRTVYRPPQDLRDFVAARDRTCRFPTCDRPASSCDLDHRHDWDEGGTTCAEWLDALCRRHHRLKHEGGWTHLRNPESGDSFWIDPGGTIHYRAATVLPSPEPVEPPAARVAESAAAAGVSTAGLDLGDPPF